jgi:RNA polymerase sigma factor (sigma-70 family)
VILDSWQVVEEKTDIELVNLALGRDKNAFGELVRRYQSLAQGIAKRLIGNEDGARDLVQEAMLQAFLVLDQLKNPARFKSWLCGIVFNVCRSYLRDRETSLLSLESLTGGRQFTGFPYAEEITGPVETAEEHEFQKALLQAVQELSPEDRDAILHFYYHQLSLQEIGAINGMPAGTVKVRLFRARKKLKEKLLSRYPEIIPCRERRKIMIKVTIVDVVKKEYLDQEGRSNINYVVVLNDEKGNRALPIWVGPVEGQSIAVGLTDFQLPRPMTFNFFANLLSAINAKVDHIRIETLKDTTFYAVVRVSCGKKIKEIDARPSDALALAVRTDSPIFASEEVLDLAGIDIGKNVTSGPGGAKLITREFESLQSQRQALGLKLSEEAVENQIKELMKSVFGS